MQTSVSRQKKYYHQINNKELKTSLLDDTTSISEQKKTPPKEGCFEMCNDFIPLPSEGYSANQSCVASWHGLDTCNGELPLRQLSPSSSTRWSANTCDLFMKPVYCMNRMTYCCNCKDNCGCEGVVCIGIITLCAAKAPFYTLAGVASSVSWVAGKTYDTFGPERQEMDPECVGYDNLEAKIVKWVDTNNLKSIIDFARESDTQLRMLASWYKQIGLAILCLAIRHDGKDVDFKWREWFIVNLLRQGVSIDGYTNNDNFMIPLYEALISHYDGSEKIVRLLCEKGADIKEYRIPYPNNRGEWSKVNLLVCAYLLYFKTTDPAVNRESYVIKAEIFRSLLNYKIPTSWFDCDAELEVVSPHIADTRNKIEEAIKVVPQLHRNLFKIVGQYTGAYPSNEEKDTVQDEAKPIIVGPANFARFFPLSIAVREVPKRYRDYVNSLPRPAVERDVHWPGP